MKTKPKSLFETLLKRFGISRREFLRCLAAWEADLSLEEWQKDDHPHAILARAPAVGVLI